MSWGSAFKSAWDGASDAARRKVRSSMESARSAATAVQQAEEAAVHRAALAAAAAKDAAVKATEAVVHKAEAAAAAAKKVAVETSTAVAHGAKNAATFGARVAGELVVTTARAAVDIAAAPYRAARRLFSHSRPPRPIQPCISSQQAKMERLEMRNRAISVARRSPNPNKREAADRLARNNEAVELARLSDDAYTQYPGPTFQYPTPSPIKKCPGWSIVPKEELDAKGVSVKDLEDARAVVYRTPDNWPGGAKTVISFRGTKDLEDLIVDHDQAMAVAKTQYKAAMRVGDSMSTAYGPSVQVTGHSLGGGKAQAAGVAGGLKGTMFNAAGLNPDTTGSMVPSPDQFSQYRTASDPLTGVQNSPMTQAAITTLAGVVAMPLGAGMKVSDWAQKAVGMRGLSPEMADYADKALKALPRGIKNLVHHGNVLPPAIGPVHEVPTLDELGREVPLLSKPGPHSITYVINGIERQKEDDLATMAA